MTDRVPLGEKEDLHREFKSRDALKKPEIIAREVVAMLNADGGTVWVGLRDDNDRAVAVEPVPDADRERLRLRDYLVDTIEPSPAGGEVEVRQVETDEGNILKIEVRPQENKTAYAHLREGGRFFLLRFDDRTRPMSREELVASLRRSATDGEEGQRKAREHLLEERVRLESGDGEVFWLGIEPAINIELDLQDQRYEDYLTDPSQTGNRGSGWSFARSVHPPILKKGVLASRPEERRVSEIRRNGGLRFRAPLESLYWKGDPKELWPYILLEYPISAFRLARRIYEDKLRPRDAVMVDLALIGIRGWKLRGGTPGTWGFSGPVEYLESKDLIWEKPLVFSFEEVQAEPDRCGYRLVERVYEAFGLGRDSIPKEFDRQTGRLILPE